ncbi:MAG TPA: hypothetical protein ENH11_01135 [Candidatus Acetothermia bacterium]|nr:hypothetical protein [Candidatus Acetothermia bacterium]
MSNREQDKLPSAPEEESKQGEAAAAGDVTKEASLGSKFLGDKFVQTHARAAFACIMVNHYCFGIIKDYMERRTAEEDKDSIPGALEYILDLLKKKSMEGMHLEDLITLLKESLLVMETDCDLHHKRLQELKAQDEQSGYEIPFKMLHRNVGRGLKPGHILVLSGETLAEAKAAYDEMLHFFNKRNVPITRFTQQSGNKIKQLGVTTITPDWWVNCCNSFNRMKDAFAVVETPVVFIDDFAELRSIGTTDSKKQLRKLLLAAAKRHRIAIVTATTQGEFGRTGAMGKLYATPVCHRMHEGEQVLMVENQIYEREEDEDERNDSGSDSEAPGELEGTRPGPEDGTPDGSGEDSGEAGGVGTDGGDGSDREPTDKSD